MFEQFIGFALNITSTKIRQFRIGQFLLDVFVIAVTAFGGPQIHFTLFHRKLVTKRKYLSEDELKELNSLCNMLPGPTSTQTITAIGFKKGGPMLAFLTLFVWVLPATAIMTAFAILIHKYDLDNPRLGFLQYLQPMAVAFIIYAAYKFRELFVVRIHHWALMIMAAVAGIWFKTPYYIPIALVIGGVVSNIMKRTDYFDVKPVKQINWSNFALWVGIFLLSAVLGAVTKNKAFLIFENSYRYGSIVFGGGHVLIPMMFNQFVEFKHYLTANEFLSGVGILQAVPGPVFSIATFAGAMAMKEMNVPGQLLGASAGTAGIFLPGILLIFFVYPIWNQIKNFSPVRNAIEGINATSAGFVISSAWLLFQPVQVNEMNMTVLLGTLFLLLTTKIPYPIIVVLCIITGFFF
ncbi:MAG: chromate efflux transporter [Bacteroidota bacterium]